MSPTILLLLLLMSGSSHSENAPALNDDSYYQFHIFKLISNLHAAFDFESFVIFSNVSLDFKMLKVFGKPIIILKEIMLPTSKLRSIVDQKTLVIVYFEDEESDYLEQNVNLNLQGMHHYKMVFIELEITGASYAEKYMNFFTRRGFVNSVIIYRTRKGEPMTARYCSYCCNLGDIFLDMSDTPAEEMFPDVFQSSTSLVISTTINRDDIPRVFSVNEELLGTSGRMFSAFLEQMNFTVYAFNYIGNERTFEFDKITAMIDSDFIEISPYVATPYYEDEKTISYPLEMIEWRLMVPVQYGIPKYLNIIYPFDIFVWILIILSIILVSCLLRLLCRRNPLLDSLAMVMNISPSTTTDPSWRYFLIYAVLFTYGFIISNFYLAIMASILTKSLEGAQINTIDDILESDIPILITQNIKSFLNRSTPNFRLLEPNLMTVSDPDFFASERNNFNTSYIYPVESDVWEFLNMRQMLVSHPTFRLADLPLIGSYGCFLMRNDSILQQPLRRFIMDTHASGLTNYWKKESFLEALKAGIVKIDKENEQVLPLDMEYFFGSFGLLAIGCLMGLLSFIVEIISAR